MDDSFVIACLSHRLYPERPLPPAPEDADWARLYALLVRHRLAGVFYRLGLEHPGLWPEALQRQLRRDYHSALLWGDRCAGEVHAVLDALAQAGIPTLVLKGWALIPTVYGGDHGQRTYCDIDLLVRLQDAEGAEQVVSALGYRALLEPRPGFGRRYHNDRPYQLPQGQGAFQQVFAIALHWQLLDTPFYWERMPVEALFGRSHTLRLVGHEVARLCPEDDLVYACGHLALHHEHDDALFRYYEIAASIRQAGSAMDWDAVVTRSQAWRMVLPVQRVLSRLAGLWPQIIPARALEKLAQLQPTRAEHLVHRWVVTHRDNHAVRVILAWLTLPGLGRRCTYLLELTFPSRRYMRHRYGPAPGGVWPLLYLQRLQLAGRCLASIDWRARERK
jgi:hypothetical protein